MKPASFNLHKAASVSETIQLLARFDDAKIIAGGQSLVPLMNLRLARPENIIDVSKVQELHTIRVQSGRLSLGAMVQQQKIVDGDIAAYLPLLSAASKHIGHRHIRNRGTIGGSICHADPAAEVPTVCVALDATMVAVGPSETREVNAVDFFRGPFTTALNSDELLLDVSFDMDFNLWGFDEYARRGGDFALVLCAVALKVDDSGTTTDARIVFGGVGTTPTRSHRAEEAMLGKKPEASTAAAVEAAAFEVQTRSDLHSSAAHRRALVKATLRNALESLSVTKTSLQPDFERSDFEGNGDETTVNGTVVSLDGIPDRKLLADWLREDLRLTGTHLGCEHGVCGACTVLLDGEPIRSCLMFAKQIDGFAVQTIESVGSVDSLSPIQEAFRDCHGLQCGFCTPGMVLTASALLARNPSPTESEIRSEISGNICRCTGYVKIVESIQKAAGFK